MITCHDNWFLKYFRTHSLILKRHLNKVTSVVHLKNSQKFNKGHRKKRIQRTIKFIWIVMEVSNLSIKISVFFKYEKSSYLHFYPERSPEIPTSFVHFIVRTLVASVVEKVEIDHISKRPERTRRDFLRRVSCMYITISHYSNRISAIWRHNVDT
jgi:hypothetical protein